MKIEDNKQIQNIISALHSHNVIPAKPSSCKKLSGGTVSELYLLTVDDMKYVLKLNDSEVTEPEALFLGTYKEIELLPKLLFVDPARTYIVYSFIEGSTAFKEIDKKEILRAVVEGLINKYQRVSPDFGWGWADSPSASWQEFLKNEISYSHKAVGLQMEEKDHQMVIELAGRIGTSVEPFLLHGDCGFHNFIFNEQELEGVIDPAPVIGNPLYDVVYAFCSSPKDLTKETFDHVISHMKIEEEKESADLYENLLIGLYLRIALCSKHHPNDLPKYLKAWDEWLEITGNAKRA